MKPTSLFLAPLAAHAATIPLERRQWGPFVSWGMTTIAPLLQTQTAIRVEKDLPVNMKRDGQTVKRMRLMYGPYKIKGVNEKRNPGNYISMDPGGTAYTYILPDMPHDATILTTNTTWVFKDGTPVSINHGLHNHHILVFDINKSPPTIAKCPDGKSVDPPISMFAGSASDGGAAFYTTSDGQFNSGYYIGKDHKILFTGDVVNYKNETQEIYHIQDVQYIEGKPANSMEAVAQFWYVGACSGEPLGFVHAPAGVKKFSVKSKEMTIAEDGQFFALRGHLHDGGESMHVKVNGVEVCASYPTYGGNATDPHAPEATIYDMNYCFPKEPIKVKKGDSFTIDAYYDLEKNPPRKHHNGEMAEEMALLAIFFGGPQVK